MSSVQTINRFLVLGKIASNVLRPDLKHIRWFHRSSILSQTQTSETLFGKSQINEEKTKQIFISSQKSSIIRLNTSSNHQTIHRCKIIWQRIIHELKHYCYAFKLLFTETKLTFNLLHQVFNGHTLTRKERKQVIRTTTDLLRLVPFSVFIIVPFMEFTLPIFLKFFPNMLPSTFKHKDSNEEKSKKYLKNRLELTKALRNSLFQSTNNDLLIRQSGAFNQKMMNLPHGKLVEFTSNLTLDNLDRLQLIPLCKLLNVPIMGPNFYLRWKVHFKVYRLKIDDKFIANEGIENLHIDELQTACNERGMNTYGVTIECLQTCLQQWLDLHLKQSIPMMILLFSHILSSSEDVTTRRDTGENSYHSQRITEDQNDKEKAVVVQQMHIHINSEMTKSHSEYQTEHLRHTIN